MDVQSGYGVTGKSCCPFFVDFDRDIRRSWSLDGLYVLVQCQNASGGTKKANWCDVKDTIPLIDSNDTAVDDVGCVICGRTDSAVGRLSCV